ncbi:MAG: DUF3347 domain-containing protein [Flavobacteriaceae bacterium]|nr:DUF3347 domain-containing protein [Flavobacteriaceae bacterium]
MKKYLLVTTALGMILMTSCGNDSKKNQNEPEVEIVSAEKVTHTSATTTVTFKNPKVASVYQSYIDLKTALVNTDTATTATEASNLMTAFANMGVDEDLLETTQSISESTDVEVQRKAFVLVTAAVEKMLEGAIDSGVIYKQYCPMAFDFEGAFWLSNSKQISNPYFGDKMLRCGKVDSEIK